MESTDTKRGKVKNPVDTRFFNPEVFVEAPQASANPIGEIASANFSSGVSAQKRFDMSGRAKCYLLLLIITLAAVSLILIHLSGKNTAASAASGTVMKTIILYGNDSPADLEILKNRLDVFTGKGRYSLTEEKNHLELCLPFSKALTDDRIELLLEKYLIEPGPHYAACAPPGVNSFIESNYTVAAVTPEDISHIDINDISNAGNSLPTDEFLQVPVLEPGETPVHRFRLKLKDSAASRLRQVLERGDDLFLLSLRIYDNYNTNKYYSEGWELKGDPDDHNTFYIEYSDSDELYGNERILKYNLTHASLTQPYNYCLMDEVKWTDPDTGISSGDYQRKENEIGDNWYYFQASSNEAIAADERADIEHLLCRRLDLLESPYAIGYTQQGDICVRIRSDRINRRVVNLLTELNSRNRYCLKIPCADYNLSPHYSKINYDTRSSSFLVTLPDEDLGSLEDIVRGSSGKEPVDLYLCTDDGPVGRTSFSLPAESNELQFSDTVFNRKKDDSVDREKGESLVREKGESDDYSWFTALIEGLADVDFSFTYLTNDFYYRHEAGTDIFNDPDSYPLKEEIIVSIEEIEKKIRQLLPQAEVRLSYDSNTLDIHMNLEHGENLPDRIYEYAPRLLEICSLKDSYFFCVRIYPCEYKEDERAWLVFSKSTKEGKTDISFSGYFFNGRMDAYADRILELEKTNSFFRDMIIDPRYDGWKVRDF